MKMNFGKRGSAWMCPTAHIAMSVLPSIKPKQSITSPPP